MLALVFFLNIIALAAIAVQVAVWVAWMIVAIVAAILIAVLIWDSVVHGSRLFKRLPEQWAYNRDGNRYEQMLSKKLQQDLDDVLCGDGMLGPRGE